MSEQVNNNNKNTEVSPRVMELLSNPTLLESATVDDLSQLAKYLKNKQRLEKQNAKTVVSKERLEKILKLKDIHTNFGYTDSAEFLKDYRAANVPAVTRSRIAPEKRAKIEEALRNNVKFASIAVDNDVSESTVGNIKRAMELRNLSTETTASVS